MLAAVLAGIIIAAQDLAPVEADSRARPINHHLQADNRRARENVVGGVDFPSSIFHQAGLVHHEETNCPVKGAGMDNIITFSAVMFAVGKAVVGTLAAVTAGLAANGVSSHLHQ